MLADANPYAGALPVNPFAREIAAVCEKHSVAHGSPGKLAGFLRALQKNKHLAMDFWSLVVRISSEENGGSVDPDWLLAVIVEGVTGWSVSSLYAVRAAETSDVNRLASMLAGEDVHPPVLEHEENRRLVLEPEPPPVLPVLPALRPLEPGSSAAFRLAGYAETNSPGILISRRLVVVLLLLACAAGGVLLLPHHNPAGWTRLRESVRARYAAVLPALRIHHATPPAANGNSASPAPTPTIEPTEPSSAIIQPHPALIQPPQIASGPSPEQHALQPVNIAPIPHEAPQIPSAVAHPASHASVPIAIPGAEMKQYLVSSRVPIYPEAARAAHAVGPVVIKALVTSHGTVQPLEVIAGDPALRHAALDAVSKWRYRPYLLDGKPVTVSTTISVDPLGNQ